MKICVDHLYTLSPNRRVQPLPPLPVFPVFSTELTLDTEQGGLTLKAQDHSSRYLETMMHMNNSKRVRTLTVLLTPSKPVISLY